MSTALFITLQPIVAGWAVCLSNGSELARFYGVGARRRAERYVSGLGRAACAGGPVAIA